VVPLWPQLEEILRPLVFDLDRPPARLLFPSRRAALEAMITNFDKVLDHVATRGGWRRGEVRTRMFRHTYTAARLQTLDGAAPVSPCTVARELGHGGLRLVDRVYGHLGQVRHRAEVVEYRVGQHEDRLRGRLAALVTSL
jgi:integrase